MAWMLPNELAGFITTKTSLPTPSTEECLYWPQEKQWVPERLLKKIKAGERKQLQRAKAIVQRAVSGQSKCRKCGGPVPKGALRVGYPTSDPRGQYEVLCCWLHVGCSSEFFSLLLQGEVEPQQHELLREDLIVRLTSLEDTPAAAAAADAAATTATATAAAGTASLASGKTPKAEDGFIDLEGSLKEGPTPCKREKKGRQKTRVSAREREAEGRGGKFEEQEDRKEAPSVASTEAPTVKGPSTASAASSSEDVSKDSPVSSSHEEGAAANQQQMKERQQQKDEERHSQRLEKTEALGEELSAKDRLLIERAGSVVSLDRLCVAEEGLSVSEQHEVHTAIAAAARRFFFPSKETEETAAAEEVLQSLTVREIKGRIAAPPGLQLPLLPFQEEGLWWLTQQEASGVKGGILADEMGMGKTIQLISLLLARPFPPLPPAAPSVLRSCVCSTLVVTPLAALLQWKSELDRFVSPGRLAVLIYHGPQRGALFSVLHEYDVVLTTYQTVEQDFRKQLNKQKKQCKYCGRLFLPSKLAIHQKYFCGPEAQRTVKQRLTERKLDSTAKAMETLNIINAEERQQRESVAAAEGTKGKGKRQKEKETPANFVPTPSNCLKELLQQANLSLSDVRPNPWLGPHFNRTARAAAETPQPPADKKRKVDRPSSSSSSSSSGSSSSSSSSSGSSSGSSSSSSSSGSSSGSSSSSSGGVGLSMADVGRLQVPQLRELLKALGQPLQARMTKAKLLELVEPLLQESLEKNETAAAAAAAATNGDSAAAHPKEVKKIVAVSDVEEEAQQETDGEEEQQQQQQQNAATKRRKSSRRSKQMIVKQEEGQCSADTDSQQQPKTLAPSSSSSSSSKPAFKYVKPTKPKQQQQQQKESEEDEGSSEDERPIAVSKGKAKAKKPLSAAKKAAAKTTKKSGKAPAKPQKKLSRPLKPRKGAKKKKPAAAAAVAATSESSVEDSGWESSSTAYEPSGSSSESVSSESFAASSSEEGSLASESEGSSSGVSVVSAGSSRRRRGTAGRSSSRPQQQGLAAASPIDELLWGKALGDTESEDEAQEGGRIRERLEEDPQLLNVLRQSPLHGVVWQRIVLDEAHRIKTRNSSTAQAIFALRSATLRVPLHQQQEQQKQQEEVAAEKDTQGEDGKGDSRAGAAPNATDVGEAAGGEGGDGEKKGDVPQTKKGRGKQPKRQKQQEQEEADEGKGLPGQEAAEASTASARRKRGPAKETLSSSTENAKEKAIVSRGQAETKQDFSLLVGGCRWCLTGTPLQNRVGELYSLVRFLRFYPYAYYFCSKKGCTCRSMHYRFPDGRYCEKCSHTRMTHYSFFCRRVVKPIKEYGYQGEGIIALETLKKEVLDVLLLRRTKVERAADVKLPPLTVHIRRDALSPQERDFYEALFKQTATQFDSYVKSGTVLHNFAHIFDLLSRLRQAVDHPYLLIHGSLQAKEGSLPLPTDSRNAKQTGVCAICQEDMEAEEMVEAKCGHAFHRVCVLEYIESAPVAAEEQQQEQQEQQQEAAALGCPACFVPLTVDLSHKEGMGEDEDGNSKPKAAKRESAKNTNRKKGRAGPEDEEEGDVGSSEEEGDEAELDSVLKQGEGGDKGDTAEAETEDRSFGPPVKSSGRQGGIMKKISASNFTSSTKIEALVQELQGAYAEDPGVKSIVFSQFCAMLDLIEFRLKKEGIHCAQLTGSMTAVARSNVLYAFHKDPNLRVILISLKAGGEGLNLQVASRIYLMDPWWNPAAEMQAIQRAHRIGQKRPVKGVRFICSDTIEERILQLQEKKQLVFDGTVGASNQAMHKLTQEDLRFLFQS